MEKICECGAKYELTYIKIGARDKDSIDCEKCGQILYSWNEGKIWSAKRVDNNNENVTASE